MDPEEWKNNFRPFAREESTKVRHDSLSLEKRLAVTLYYLKDQGSMKMTTNSFGIARCTVGRVVEEICTLISKNTGLSFIVFPSEKNDVLNATSCFWQKFRFPQVISCVDETHIPIKQPSENAPDYFSYKLCYTLNCQTICDTYGKFINVEIKWLGSVHDVHVFANCKVQESFTSGNFKLFYRELLLGHEYVPQLLLGDPAYPLLPYWWKNTSIVQVTKKSFLIKCSGVHAIWLNVFSVV